MSSVLASSVTFLRNSLFFIFRPCASTMARRKLRSGTPGISTGAWKLRNSPARLRLSGARSVMSFPSKVTFPDVTS